MLKSIMNTAFCPPHFNEKVLKRAKCFQKFINNLHKRLVFIKAGAGFGKTILMGEFYQQLKKKKLWFSIPELYFTLDKFFIYLFYRTLELLESDQKLHWEVDLEQVLLGFLETDKVVSYLINLFEEISQDLYIFIDDLQFVSFKDQERDQRMLQMFFRFVPTNVHFVISSREEFPIPLNKFRLEKQILLLKKEDLILEPDELVEFLHLNEISLIEEQFNWLYQSTEGWIAGVCLSLHHFQELGEVNPQMTLEDYLTEIIADAAEDLRIFLKKTSVIVGIIDPEVCNEFLGIQNSELLLDQLTESYFLTQRYDEAGKVFYRYHQLLKEFFIKQLDEEMIQNYNLELAAIYRDQQLVELEIIHLIRAGQDLQATELLKKDSRRILASSDINLLMEWLDSYKKEEVDPLLEIYRGLLRELKWCHDEALPYYKRAELILRDTENVLDWVKVNICIAGIYRFKAENQKSLQICEMVLPHVPEGESAVLADLYRTMGNAYLGVNLRSKALEYYKTALELSCRIGDLDKESILLNNIALEEYLPDGKIKKAKDALNQAMQNFKKHKNTTGVGFILCNLAYLLFVVNELDTAMPLLAQSEEIFLKGVCSNNIRMIWFLQARVALKQGDLQKAEERLARVEKSLDSCENPQYLAHYALCKGILFYKLGDFAQAEEWFNKADQFVLLLGKGNFIYYEFKIQRIIFFLLSERYQEVIDLGEEILGDIRKETLELVRLETNLLLAIASKKLNRTVSNEITMALNKLECETFKFLKQKYQEFLEPLSKQLFTDKSECPEITDIVSPIQVIFFGNFRIYYSGEWITEKDWTNRKALDVLKYLIIHHDRWVRQEELLDNFWPDSDIEKAKQTLYVALYTIRRQWEPELQKSTESQFLETKRGLCKFYLPEPYWIDLENFGDFANEGLKLYQERRFLKAQEFLREAKKLYQNDLLVENIYDEWTQTLRDKYLEKYLEVLITLSGIEGEIGNFSVAIELLYEALNKNPFLDQVHELIMQFMIQSGNPNNMIQHYQEYSQIYLKELGVEMPKVIQHIYWRGKG